MASINTTSSIDLSALRSHHAGSSAAAKRYQDSLNFADMVRSNGNRTVEDNESRVNMLIKPDAGYFAELTGVDEGTANELIHGVVGSNKDTRDWQAIMTSDDPLSAVRAETAKMYNSGADYASALNNNKIDPATTVATSGNYALEQLKTQDGTVAHQGLKLVDSQGMILRDAGSSPEQIARNSWLFGVDTRALNTLVEPAARLSSSLSQAIAQVTGQVVAPVVAAADSQPASVAAAASIATTPAVQVTSTTPATTTSTAATTTTAQPDTTSDLDTVTSQLADLSAKLASGSTTSMSQFMASYNQLQSLMARMTDLQKAMT